jgi:pimeloyl-ACP methyl ester carboxylesterase
MTVTAGTRHSEFGVEVVASELDVDGLTVRWFDTMVERPGANTVVLVHGTGGSTQAHFSFLLPMLAAQQRVVSIDLATPHGDPEQGVDRLAQQVVAVLRETHPDAQVTLVGYSLGAVVAAAAAAAAPEAVGALVLCAGWLRTDSQQLLRNDVWHSLRKDPEALGRYHVFCAFSGRFLALCGPAEIQYLASGARHDDDIAQQMMINRVVDLTEAATRITCPTLVVAGTDDVMTPVRQAKRLFGAIAEARYTEIGSGHAMIAERQAELVHLINSFSAAPERDPAGTILPPVRP